MKKKKKKIGRFLDAIDTLLECPITKKRFIVPVILITDHQNDEVTLEESAAKQLVTANQATGYRKNLLVEQILELMNDKTPWYQKEANLVKLFICSLSYELFNEPTLLIHNNPDQSAMTLEKYWADNIKNNKAKLHAFSATDVMKCQKNELVSKIINTYFQYFPEKKLEKFEYTKEKENVANAQNPISKNRNRRVIIRPANTSWSIAFEILLGLVIALILFKLFIEYRLSLVNKSTEVVCENATYNENNITMDCYTRPIAQDIRFLLRCISSFSDECVALYQKTSQGVSFRKVVPIQLTEDCHASFFARCLERPHWRYTGPQFENNTEGLEYPDYDSDRRYGTH